MGLRILFVASEMAPFVKTGGLADVVEGLPAALKALGHDVRVLIPAYASAQAPGRAPVAAFRPRPGDPQTGLSVAMAPRSGVPVWLLDGPGFGDRPGNPYLDRDGRPYPDNAARFNRLCRTAASIAANAAGLDWRPDVVHCHDWHAGLTPVWMMLERVPAAIVFTLHNLGYQGLFPRDVLGRLGLPDWLWHYRALEFHGQLSFLKGGLVFADRLTTVSPTYAREIQGVEWGCGLDGVLTERSVDLTGIQNGIDTTQWSPELDPLIAPHYSLRNLQPKQVLKQALLGELGLPARPGVPLLAFVGRLVDQKGIDVLLAALPALLKLPLQIAALGAGAREYERALGEAAAGAPDRIAARLEYNEALAHRLYAGADMLVMPSRFEPCGLNQLYAMRYGTVPIVHRVGGLADTVVDVDQARTVGDGATGISFAPLDASSLVHAVGRAVEVFRQDAPRWHAMIRSGMRRDDSWGASAQRYLDVYRDALSARAAGP